MLSSFGSTLPHSMRPMERVCSAAFDEPLVVCEQQQPQPHPHPLTSSDKRAGNNPPSTKGTLAFWLVLGPTAPGLLTPTPTPTKSRQFQIAMPLNCHDSTNTNNSGNIKIPKHRYQYESYENQYESYEYAYEHTNTTPPQNVVLDHCNI